MNRVSTLILIRHATNDSLREGWLPGRLPGVHLNEAGRLQAEALAERLAGVNLAAVYASPMDRAVETARPIADRHGLEVELHPGLNEIDVGRWEGESFDRLRRRPLWRRILAYPSGTRFPGGETAWEAQARVITALDEIIAAHAGETVAVVFHADPIRMAVAHYLGLPLALYRRLKISPASLTVLTLGGPVPQLMRLNDTAHLEEKRIRHV